MQFQVQAKLKDLDTTIMQSYRSYEKWAQQINLPLGELVILYELLINQTVTQRQLIQATNFPKQTINQGTKNLVAAGYVQLTPDSNDRRCKVLMLTTKGKTYAKQKVAPLFIIEERMLARLGEAKLDLLMELIREYGDLLAEETDRYWQKTKEEG